MILLTYEIGDKVTITEPKIQGVVDQILITAKETQYLVAYWHDHDKKHLWCDEKELEPTDGDLESKEKTAVMKKEEKKDGSI